MSTLPLKKLLTLTGGESGTPPLKLSFPRKSITVISALCPPTVMILNISPSNGAGCIIATPRAGPAHHPYPNYPQRPGHGLAAAHCRRRPDYPDAHRSGGGGHCHQIHVQRKFPALGRCGRGGRGTPRAAQSISLIRKLTEIRVADANPDNAKFFAREMESLLDVPVNPPEALNRPCGARTSFQPISARR